MDRKVFLNISNHPSDGWLKLQRTEAEKCGEIEDFPFPQVNPAAGKDQVELLAAEYRDMILKTWHDACLTVHVMGEQTFCFALITMLKERGIRCVASCTERKVTELEGGKRVSEFNFVRFREY